MEGVGAAPISMNCSLTIALLTKNSERTVGYALTSLARQRVPKGLELEIIVVDGYSEDRTLEILNRYMPKLRQRLSGVLRRTLIVRERVNTVSFARNLALKLADGEWILWLDSDNVLHSNYLIRAFEAIKRAPEKVAVIYPKRVIPLYNVKSSIQKAIALYLLYCTKARLTTSEVTIQGLRYTAMQGTLCRTKHLREVGGFNPLLPAAEDVGMFILLMSKGYVMSEFDSTLYFFVRSSLRSWFRQAMYWDYGKYILHLLHRDMFRSTSKDFRECMRGSAMLLITNALRILKCTRSAAYASNNVLSTILIPLLYVYRRLGFYVGWRSAERAIKQLK